MAGDEIVDREPHRPSPAVGIVPFEVERVLAAKQLSRGFEEDAIGAGGIGRPRVDDDAVSKAKPTGAKGTYMQRAAISSTMGPGVRLDIGSLATQAQVGT